MLFLHSLQHSRLVLSRFVPQMSYDWLPQYLTFLLPKTFFPTSQHLLAPLKHSELRLHLPLPGSVSLSWPSTQCSLKKLMLTTAADPSWHLLYYFYFNLHAHLNLFSNGEMWNHILNKKVKSKKPGLYHYLLVLVDIVAYRQAQEQGEHCGNTRALEVRVCLSECLYPRSVYELPG